MKISNNDLQNNISKVIIYQILGGLFALLLGLISTFVFSRLLTPSDYGHISSFTSWSSIMVIVVGLQVGGTIGMAKKKYINIDSYCSCILFLSFCSYLIFQFIFIILRKKISILMGFPELIVPLIVLYSYFSYILVIYYTKLEYEFLVKKKVIYEAMVSFIVMLLSFVLVVNFNEGKYIGRIIGMIIPTIIIGGLLFINIIVRGKIIISKEYWKYCLSLSVPLIFHSASGAVLTQSDIIMLKKMVNPNETGIYGIVYSIAIVISTLWVALNRSWVPFYYKYKLNNDVTQIKNKSKGYMFLFTSLTVGFLLCAQDIFKVLTPYNYWDGIKIIPIVVCAYYLDFLYSFPVNHEFYYENTKMISIATTLSAIINIILNFWLIPKYHSLGAALSTVVSYFVCFVFHDICARYVIKKFEYSWFFYLIGLFCVLLTCVLYFLLKPFILLRWTMALVLAFINIVVMYKKKSIF